MKDYAMFSLRLAAGIAISMAVSGCSASIGYRPDYVPDREVIANEAITGRVLVYTTRTDDERLITTGGTNFNQRDFKLTMPIGIMTREIGVKVFSKVATEGAAAANDLTDAARFALVVKPENKGFKYGLPTLKNLGFATSPEIQVEMKVSVIDASGKTVFEKDYASEVVEGKTSMMNTQPYELINKLAHETIYDLMRRAAADIGLYQSSISAP
jgi:hypothetical protein